MTTADAPEPTERDHPAWYQALRLDERRDAPPVPADRGDEARETLRRWRAETGLGDDRLFAERLARDGLTEDELLAILAEPAEDLAERAPDLPWLDVLLRAYDTSRELAAPESPSESDSPRSHLVALVHPLVATAGRDLAARLDALTAGAAVLDRNRVLDSLTTTLTDGLESLAERSLVLELHLRRLQGTLPGDDPESRFRAFAGALRNRREALEVLRAYPPLARALSERATAWVETSTETIERFLASRERIAAFLHEEEDPGPLVAIRTGLGDRHEGGRTVARLTFAGGGSIYYKPRSLAVDRAFGALVAWLARHRGGTGAPDLRTPRVLDEGTHGWAEAIVARPCDSEDEVERFYERQGAWAALLYAVEATDFHYENVIADGEHPVPVDLETVFQPMPDDPTSTGPGSNPMRETVLGSGLLPRRGWQNVEEGGIDLTALGAVSRRRVPVRHLAREATDDLRYELRETDLSETFHLPRLDGRPAPPWRWRSALTRGFEAMYDLLLRERGRLTAQDGPLAAFEDAEVRVIVRGTTIYVRLLDAGGHPDYLRTGLEQDRLFDKLWIEAARYPCLRPLVANEAAALSRRDVPRFRARVGSRNLELQSDPHGPSEPGRLEGWLAASGIDRVRQRLAALGPDDRALQTSLLRISLETLRPASDRFAWPERELQGSGSPASGERFVEAAAELGRRLRRRAILHRDHASWLALQPLGGASTLGPVSIDLYGGLSGIALFLAHLGAVAGDRDATDLARRAVASVRSRMRINPRAVAGGAGLGGSGGVAYAFARLAVLWEDEELLDEAERLTVGAARGIADDRTFDLIGGATGLAAAALAIHALRPSDALTDGARCCGDHLLEHAVETRRGLAWPTPPGAGDVPLSGFGHGSAGCSWVLARLAALTGEGRFEAAARRALAYERSWFDPERGSWADTREDRRTEGGPGFVFAWCHGAPGIGRGRAGLLGVLEDDALEEEVRAAAEATLAEGFGGNHSLCHGDLGNLEAVTEAAAALGDRDLARRADRMAAAVLESIERHGPRCGSHVGDEPPGLFTGLAGIGYGLLRLGAPDRVPSVLTMAVEPSPSSEPSARSRSRERGVRAARASERATVVA